MSIRNTNILLLFTLSLFLLSCGTNDLSGKWRPATIRRLGKLGWEKSSTFDLSNTDSLRSFLMSSLLIDDRITYTNDSDHLSVVDSSLRLKQVDSVIKRIRAASIALKNDSKFLMISNGVILPQAIPGWHFADTLAGTWLQKNDILVLRFDNNNSDLTIQYRIVELDKHVLVLRQFFYGTEMAPDIEIKFERQ